MGHAPIELSEAIREQQCRFTRAQLKHIADLSAFEIDAIDDVGKLSRQPYAHRDVGQQAGCLRRARVDRPCVRVRTYMRQSHTHLHVWSVAFRMLLLFR